MKRYIKSTQSIQSEFVKDLFYYIADQFVKNSAELMSNGEPVIKVSADIDDVLDVIDDFIASEAPKLYDDPIASHTEYDKVISIDNSDKVACLVIDYNDIDASTYIDIIFNNRSDLEGNIEMSQCSFDFDLGDSYDQYYLENELTRIFDAMDLEIEGIDFRSVDYPGNKVYSQCGIDFKWSEYYNEAEIEEDIANLIEDEGGNFLGIDFSSYEG